MDTPGYHLCHPFMSYLMDGIVCVMVWCHTQASKATPSLGQNTFQQQVMNIFMQWSHLKRSYSLVDEGGLRTHFSDPMHTLGSSGYTLSGMYIDDFLNLHHPTYKSIGFGRFAQARKKSCFSSLFDSHPPDY